MSLKRKECLSFLNPNCSKRFATPRGLTLHQSWQPTCAPLVGKILRHKLQQQAPSVKVELAASVDPFLKQINALFKKTSNNAADTDNALDAKFPNQVESETGLHNAMSTHDEKALLSSHFINCHTS